LGKLYVVGIGPGGIEHMTLRAKQVIEESEVIVGYTKYIKLVEDLIVDKEVFQTGMKGEMERCKKALELSHNKIVSIISTGDAGIYGMAGLIFEMKEESHIVEIVPGVTAAVAGAALLGAPLMHDSCYISLSDLMTPYDLIKKRVELAAQGDFVISFYNPRSNGRPNHLRECIDLIRKYRDGNTPVGVVKNALRRGEKVKLFTLDTFSDNEVDMLSIVIIGNSNTFIKEDKIITPRGYAL